MKTNTSDEGFARAERVLKRADFERAYSSGFRTQSRFMTVFIAPNGGSLSRLGVAATRKLGPAVVRNRAKRLTREVFRRHKVADALDVVVVPRREMLDAPFTIVEAAFIAALETRRSRHEHGGAPRPRRSKPARRHSGV